MKVRILALTLVIVMLMAITAMAFDGQRKGFLLGGGLGFGMTSYTIDSEYSGSSDRENKGAFMTDFKIGYAPNEQLEIYYASKVSWFGVDRLGENVTVSTGIGGLGCSYSLKTLAPTWFLTGALGFSGWSYPFEDPAPDPMQGAGIYVGAGYEFTRHLSLEMDLMYGNPNHSYSGNKVTAKPFSVKFTINALAY